MSHLLDRTAIYRMDGDNHRHLGINWGRLFFISIATGRIFRLPTPSGESLEPDAWDFADLVNEGRVQIIARRMPVPPRRATRRPWQGQPGGGQAALARKLAKSE